MAPRIVLSLASAESLATAALVANRTGPANALTTARALVAAEADGQAGHGLSRIPSYAMQSRAGKVDGFAVPSMQRVAAAALRIDAGYGFAYPAINLAIDHLAPISRASGIAIATIHRSHHFGQAGAHAERLAAHGQMALVLGNTPKAMALWGGKTPRLGTNPIAFAVPLPDGRAPLVIDLALTVAARAKIVAAQKNGTTIPSDWATDAEGLPTTDPAAALAGTLLPIGGAKGAALALMVEIIAAALTGSAFGWEASSMFDDQGGPPNIGQTLIAIHPQPVSADQFPARMSALLAAVAAEPAVRLPGERRLKSRAHAASEGLAISAALHAEITALANARD
jgi:(2R)-3-sulfolactate dehydrogenase (NADP+)